MVRRGFTIVELLVIIVVMGILLVLGVANLRGSQAQARDKQREVNVETIANNIEDAYNTGKSDGTSVGRYRSTGLATSPTTSANIPNVDPKVLIDPGAPNGTTNSLVAATNTVQTVTGVAPLPSSSNLVYVYQPLYIDGTGAWALCTSAGQTCRKFNLYYYQETTNSVVMVTSRNQ